jgi:hypothetical protein
MDIEKQVYCYSGIPSGIFTDAHNHGRNFTETHLIFRLISLLNPINIQSLVVIFTPLSLLSIL